MYPPAASSGYVSPGQPAGGGSWGWGQKVYGDVETGVYPGYGEDDSAMRWGFVRKVYGILSAQLLLTMAVASAVVFIEPFKAFLLATPGLSIVLFVVPFIAMGLLFCYSQSHPLNLILLGVFTLGEALAIGVVCAYTEGLIVVEALALTAAVVVGLTLYTFYAVRQGQDFSFLGPALFAALLVLIVWGFINIFIHPGHMTRMVYALVGALLFSLYIVYDTNNLLQNYYSYDDYIWASIALYIDVINVFLYLLQFLREFQGND